MKKIQEPMLTAWEVGMSQVSDGVFEYTGRQVFTILHENPPSEYFEQIHQIRQTQKILRNYRDAIFLKIQMWKIRIRDVQQFVRIVWDCLEEIDILKSQFSDLHRCILELNNGFSAFCPRILLFPYFLQEEIQKWLDDPLYMDNKKRIDDMLLLIYDALYCFDPSNILIISPSSTL